MSTIAECDAPLIANPWDAWRHHGDRYQAPSRRASLTTMSGWRMAATRLTSPLESMGTGERGILASEHAAAIRRASSWLASGAPHA